MIGLIVISLAFYALAILAIIGLGIVYSFRKRLMPYHLKILEKSWEEIEPKFQFLFCKLLNGAGFASLAYGATLAAMIFFYLISDEGWILWAIPIFGLIGTLPLLGIVLEVNNRTSALPPLKLAIGVNMLFVMGLLCSMVELIFY